MQEQEVLVSRLRIRAAQCRQSAQRALVIGIARALQVLAEDYEHDADRLAQRIDLARAALSRGSAWKHAVVQNLSILARPCSPAAPALRECPIGDCRFLRQPSLITTLAFASL
jgi:hypothetical protein